ncbi:MAG: hypothetical protein NTW07_03315, partial [candidate division Zixibacteria bacterium]|nr:hypothetical protein [candidate division Zixibacteria bacterium]
FSRYRFKFFITALALQKPFQLLLPTSETACSRGNTNTSPAPEVETPQRPISYTKKTFQQATVLGLLTGCGPKEVSHSRGAYRKSRSGNGLTGDSAWQL